MTTGITVFFAITMSLLIFVAIGWNIRSIMRYKKEVANLKVGDKYIYALKEYDPFINFEAFDCTIKEIRYDKRKQPYVKYVFKDGSWNTMRFDKFIEKFEKVNRTLYF